MSNLPTGSQSDEKKAKDIARSWVIADDRDKLFKKKQAELKDLVDPNDPRAQYVGMIKSLIYGKRCKMSDTEITIADETFDISDLQLDCRFNPIATKLIEPFISPTWNPGILHRLLQMPKLGIGQPSDEALSAFEELLYLESPDKSGTIKIPEVKGRSKNKYTNRETGKTFEADSVYDIPTRDRLRSAVYKRKVDNKKKKKLKKKNQKRNKKRK